MVQEAPGQTLQATALVHNAYIRLVDVEKARLFAQALGEDVEKAQHWDSRGHFFAAAVKAMRRILVETPGESRGSSTEVICNECR